MVAEILIIILVGAVVTLAVLYGQERGKAKADAQVDAADAKTADAVATASDEREARERADRGVGIGQEGSLAAPPTLPPRGRMDAVDRWTRLRMDAERVRREAARRRAVPENDDTPPTVPDGRAPGAPRKPDR